VKNYFKFILPIIFVSISYIALFAQDENLYYNTCNKAPINGYFANQIEIFSGVSYPFQKNINLNIETQLTKKNGLSIGGGYYFQGTHRFTIINLVNYDADSFRYTTDKPGSLFCVFFRHYRYKYSDGYNLSFGILHHRLSDFVFNEFKFMYGHNFILVDKLSIKFDIGLKYCDYSGKIPFTSFNSIGFSPTGSLSLGYILK
jgi:hypothetical protein